MASLPDFRRYLRAKARLLGHDGALPWWDLFAPVGRAEGVDVGRRGQRRAAGVRRLLARRSKGCAIRAFDEQWVDAEMRDGKRGGAYCMSVEGDVSRVMMNFDGSHDSVSTLAHELGHAYHNVTLAGRTAIQRRLPMALAETASIFCETLMFEESAKQRDRRHRTARVARRAPRRRDAGRRRHPQPLPVRDRVVRAAAAHEPVGQGAQHGDARRAGSGVRRRARTPNTGTPYMWAVKPHYFTPFYNWPYTFGLLFGIGLYAQYVDDPERFRAGYDDMLSTRRHAGRGHARGPLRLRHHRAERSGPTVSACS